MNSKQIDENSNLNIESTRLETQLSHPEQESQDAQPQPQPQPQPEQEAQQEAQKQEAQQAAQEQEQQKKGMLISFEGLDGSGKTVTSLTVQEILEERGRTVKYISFPQYETSFFGPIIKNVLHTHTGIVETDPKLLTFLFAGDRFEAKDKIKGWIDQGFIVIANRYVTSNIAYGMAKSKDEDEFMRFNEMFEYETCGIPKPDCVIFLDTPTDVIDKRLKSRESEDGYEKNRQFLQNVRKCYLKLVHSNETWKYVSTLEDDHIVEPAILAKRIIDAYL